MPEIKPRPIQSRIKHEILASYLATWGGIIANGLNKSAKRSDPDFKIHYVYVDCFASTGRFERDTTDNPQSGSIVFGSPIIGVRELDKVSKLFSAKYGINIITNSILIERDIDNFIELQNSLVMAGYDERFRKTEDFESLKNGEIAIINSDSTKIVDKLLKYTAAQLRFAFYFIDPYGPTGIPLSFVRKIINKQKHDTIVNMPYQDLHKKTGYVLKTPQTDEGSKLLNHYDLMFGSLDWQNIVKRAGPDWEKLDEDLNKIEKSKIIKLLGYENEFVTLYQQALQSNDNTITIKKVRLRFQDRERTMFYLYLTTHDPSGALEMNRILRKAGLHEQELRQLFKMRKIETQRGQTSIDWDSLTENEPIDRSVNKEVIANVILLKFQGKVVSKRGIYKVLADEIYEVQEIDDAIKYLKDFGKAQWNGPLTISTLITFK